MKTWLKRTLWGIGGFVVVIQLVPYGRAHDNPPVLAEPAWDSPETRAFAVRTCFDCHSNEVKWPWYSHVAPISWLVQHDVDDARHELNFSEWGRDHNHGDDAAHEYEEGEMPPWQYLPAHPEAKLTDVERAAFLRGLRATFGDGHDDEGADEGSEEGDGGKGRGRGRGGR